MWKSGNSNNEKNKTSETGNLDPTETLNAKLCGNQKVKPLKSCNCTNFISFQYFKSQGLTQYFLLLQRPNSKNGIQTLYTTVYKINC